MLSLTPDLCSHQCILPLELKSASRHFLSLCKTCQDLESRMWSCAARYVCPFNWEQTSTVSHNLLPSSNATHLHSRPPEIFHGHLTCCPWCYVFGPPMMSSSSSSSSDYVYEDKCISFWAQKPTKAHMWFLFRHFSAAQLLTLVSFSLDGSLISDFLTSWLLMNFFKKWSSSGGGCFYSKSKKWHHNLIS